MPQEENALSSRRHFIKKASLGVGSAALASSAPFPLWTPPSGFPPDQKLGVALVGLGNYATGQLAPALQETELCYLAGIVTGTPSKAKAWKEKYDLPESNIYNYETFDRIADNDDIDIVYVVLPNSMHAEYTIRAAEAGKHVISEKPMATSVADCERMIEACEEANRKLSIGYRLQFEPHHLRVMELGQEEVFGPVRMMQNSFGFTIGDPTQWRLDKEMAGGGALMDVGIYAIQASRYTVGKEPVSVMAQEFKTDHEKFDEVDETIFWQLEFPGDVGAQCSSSYNTNINRLWGGAEEGWFELEPAYSYGGLQGRTSEGPMNIENVTQQALQMDAFADCIINDRESRVPGEEGLRDMKIIEAIYASIDRGGEKVDLDLGPYSDVSR